MGHKYRCTMLPYLSQIISDLAQMINSISLILGDENISRGLLISFCLDIVQTLTCMGSLKMGECSAFSAPYFCQGWEPSCLGSASLGALCQLSTRGPVPSPGHCRTLESLLSPGNLPSSTQAFASFLVS